jgi:hypothetical protein
MKILVAGFVGCAAMALTTIASPALANARQPSTDATPAASATPASAVKAKRYCVVYSVTESRIERKVCKTRDEWMRDDNFDPLNS